MNHISGLDRHQVLLLPESIEDYVSAENPVRFLDAFVSSLDLHALEFARAKTAATGRPPLCIGIPMATIARSLSPRLAHTCVCWLC